LRNFILAAYGAVYTSVEISNDGSTFTYTPATDAYKKYLETMKLMYDEGLMDPNTFQNQDASMAGKGYDNRLGMFCAAAPYLVVGEDKNNNYEAFGPLTSTYYTGTPLQYGFSPFKASGAMIPKGTPYVREIARLLDIMYSDLGTQLIAYGEEGVDWTWDNEEKTSWTFHVPETWEGTQEEYRATITPNVGTGAALYWSYDFVGKMNDPIITRLNSESERYVPYLKVPVPEEVILAKEDYSPVSLALADLGNYVQMTEYEFIVGERNIETGWAEYMTDLKGYGYENVLARYNAALARKNAK
jgi:putative aldouronate transport system substrate-binding protein